MREVALIRGFSPPSDDFWGGFCDEKCIYLIVIFVFIFLFLNTILFFIFKYILFFY